MTLVAAWELIALDDQGDGTQRVTAVAEVLDGSLRLVSAEVQLSPEQAEALMAEGIRRGEFRRP